MPYYVHYFVTVCEGNMTMNESYTLYLNSSCDFFYFYVCCIAHTCLYCLPKTLTAQLPGCCSVCVPGVLPASCLCGLSAYSHLHFPTRIKFAVDPWELSSRWL
jgi:hypothetical protein